MAVTETAIATWSGGTAYARVEAYEAGRDDANGFVDIYWWIGTRDTHPSVTGTWDWSRYGQAGNASGSVGAATGIRGIQSGTQRVYCDANGNYSDFGLGEHLDVYYGQGDAVVHVDPGRSPLAPGIAGIVADTIKVKTVRLGVEITGNGHGTSTAMRMYYRKVGDSTWMNTSDQGDVAGYNYWDVSDLTPSTNYEYFGRVWNNNGDTRDSGISTFTTLPAPSTSAALLRILGVL